MMSMFSTTPEASEAAKKLLPTIDRPSARIVKFLFADQVAKLEKGDEDFHHRGYIEAYGLDGLCIIEVTDLPACRRTTDSDYDKPADDEGNYPDKPHEHKPWCNTFGVAIPFVRGPSRRVKATYGEHVDERNGWGWDGNREKPSLTPSFLMEHWHTVDDKTMPGTDRTLGVLVHFHCFVGNPYGPGTGRFGPGALDILESSIKTHDGRQVPMVLG